VYGWANGPTDFRIDSVELRGGAAPIVQPFVADFVQNSVRYDFDGNYTINWTPQGAVDGYEIEQSTDGINWTIVGVTNGSANSGSFSNVSDGTYSYRVRAVTDGRVGKYVTVPSNVESITVSRRVEVDATGSINAVNKSITFPAGSTELVTALKNQSSTTYFPFTKLEIVSVQSAGNSVRVSNADNGGDGIANTAVFDYSSLFGPDFTPNEESGTRLIKFTNPNTVLFTFTARVKSFVLTGGGTPPPGVSGGGAGSGGSGASSGSGGGTTSAGSQLLQFTVNPITNTVSISLLQ
ncbi:MAG: hypothetical protein ACR2F2_13860, partial [Pyrinomonadaceae bacterium]